MTNQFDAIIIGTGQAGPFLAKRLAAAGMKVAIIERKLFGGTCVNTGCIPTKTMVASAYAAHMARRAADYGVAVDGSVSVDMRARQGEEGRHLRAVEDAARDLAEEDGKLHRLRGPCPFRVSSGRQCGHGQDHRRSDLHQRRWTRGRASNAWDSSMSNISPTAR